MNTLKADFFTEEKVNLSLSNSEPKSVSPPSPRVLLTHCNVITLLVLILSSFLTITNNALSQPMKFLYDQIIQENNLSFITVTKTTNQITLKIDYSNLNYSIDSTEYGWYINMENFGGNGPQGHPDLPYRTYTLELPANVILSSISTTLDSIYSTIAGNYTPFKSVVVYVDTIVLDEQNEEIYNTNANYPANPISITSPSNMREWVFIGFELYPFQYNPVTGDLIKIDSIEYIISFDLGPEKDIPSDSTNVPGYCIITTQAIKDSSVKLEDFTLSKERIGFDCFIVTVDSLDNCNFSNLQSPGERPERIRRYLQENYIEKNIEYVLLIGNPDPNDQFADNDNIGDVPMKMTYPQNTNLYRKQYDFYTSPRPTDLYYSDLTGNWDLDGDLLYGEIWNYNNNLSPFPGLINDTSHSIRWTGFIIKNSIPLKFRAFYKDGVKIWINDTLLDNNNNNSRYYWSDSNSWSNHQWGKTAESNFFNDDTLRIKVEFFKNNKDSWLLLDYLTSENQWFSDSIPNSFFKQDYYGTLQPGLVAEYFNNTSLLVPPDTTCIVSNIQLNNAKGDKGLDISNNIYGVNFLPEVIIGRIPVYDNNIYYLDSILDKSINYQYITDVKWRKNLFMNYDLKVGHDLWKVSEAINKLCDSNSFNSFRIYSKNYGGDTLNQNNLLIIPVSDIRIDSTIKIWNSGFYGLFDWHTHGTAHDASGVITSWPFYPNKTTNMLSRNYPSFVFQSSCLNAYPEDSINLACTILKHKAAGTVASTRKSFGSNSYDPNSIIGTYHNTHLTYWFTKLILNNKNFSIGKVLSLIRTGFAEYLNYTAWFNILQFNLYGDPSLILNSTVSFFPLQSGWNFISSYLIPDRNSLKSLLSLTNGIGIVKNQIDEIFIPDSVDEIGIWNYKEAYKIYMNNSVLLFISGSKVYPIFDTIPLKSGWNWVSYLRNSNMSIDTANALKSIKNYLYMVKNNSGLIYLPAYGINQIGNMIPNQGYEISVNADCNLVYPQDSTSYSYKSRINEESILSPIAKKLTPFVTNTGNDCTVIFDDLSIPDGYEIGIINGEGILIGAGAVQNQVCALTVWGKDNLNNTEGALKGEELFAFTIDTTNNRIEEIEIINIKDFLTKENLNSLTYEKGKIYVCNANAELATINENMFISNQPNPFNDQTEITYKIPESGNVVVNINSIHGEIVATYNEGNQEAGIYNILFDGSNLLGGVYVIDLIFENERVQSIMILIK